MDAIPLADSHSGMGGNFPLVPGPLPLPGARAMGALVASHPRPYMQRTRRPSLPPVTKWLLILNLGIFLVDVFSRRDGMSVNWINDHFFFTVHDALGRLQLWRFVTFQFLHADFGHVLFNCIGIYFFGPFVERHWGTRRFIAYYLTCGAAGALFYVLLRWIGLIPNPDVPLVGASAGVFGFFAAIYVLAPAMRVGLFFLPVTFTLRQLAIGLAAIAVGTILLGYLMPGADLNSGGQAGHLGGAIAGFVMMKFPWLLRRGKRPGRKVIRPKEFTGPMPSKLRPRSHIDPNAATEVDRILDKVGREGIGSLTDKEKKVLERASREKK